MPHYIPAKDCRGWKDWAFHWGCLAYCHWAVHQIISHPESCQRSAERHNCGWSEIWGSERSIWVFPWSHCEQLQEHSNNSSRLAGKKANPPNVWKKCQLKGFTQRQEYFSLCRKQLQIVGVKWVIGYLLVEGLLLFYCTYSYYKTACLLTHGQPRCLTHQHGSHSSQAKVQTAPCWGMSHTPNLHWQCSAPPETWR